MTRISEFQAETRWKVWRQDDKGNRFLVSGGHAQAQRTCDELEAKGPKQMDWITPVSTPINTFREKQSAIPSA